MNASEASQECKYWLGLTLVPGIGAAKIAKLIDHFGSAEAAWLASDTTLQGIGLDRRARKELISSRASIDLDKILSTLHQRNISVLHGRAKNYPALLAEIPLPPPLLYGYGQIEPQDSRAIAVVGSRRMTQYGRQVTIDLVKALVRHGVTIVSGLARGIDTVAHQTALREGGRTLAILGSGLDRLYPPENRQLAREIVANGQGAVLTEYPLGTKPDARHFPLRNRIISGLSRGVVVVEAGHKSGALITTTFALEQDREVFAVPGSINSPLSQGTNALLRDGATIVTSVDDILGELRWQQSLDLPGRQLQMPGSSEEISLWTHLSAEPVHVDDLCRLSELPAQVVTSTLAMMELKGMVCTVEPLHYVISR